MLCHVTIVAQNTKASNLTGTIFKSKECVEITEDIQGKIIIFSPRSTHKHTQTHTRTILTYFQHLTCNSTNIK